MTKDLPPLEARNASERCNVIAGDGSLCRGTRCMYRRRHRGPHCFGNCEYERVLLRRAGRCRRVGKLEVFDWADLPPGLKRKLGQPDPM
jgi:hypothetical protein